MGRRIDYPVARTILEELFMETESAYADGSPPTTSEKVRAAIETIIGSKTQAYREVLVGCAIARILDTKIDIRKIYINQGEDAFNGRTLDEEVINPFLHDHEIPSSKGPYLSVFRRNVSLNESTGKGVRDKTGYAAMLDFIVELENADKPSTKMLLASLLYGLIKLRDEATITLSRIQRLSMGQYGALIDSMLATPSGGLIPVLLAVSTFIAIRDTYLLPWEIEWQGINVADSPSGAGGDITINREGKTVISVEVTERSIDRARVISTFNTKISLHGIDDYLFFFSATEPTDDARLATQAYFAQGHKINFLPVKDWILTVLTSLGTQGRAIFTANLLTLLESKETPASIKVAWNNYVRNLIL